MPRPLLIAVVVVALALAAPTSAHVVAKTPFVNASSTSEIELEVPNERDEEMIALHVIVPSGFRMVTAQSQGKWLPTVTSTTATWSGGSLAPNAIATFTLSVEAPATPGAATLTAHQHYPGGATVTWPVDVTVIPADEPSRQLRRALVLGLLGLVLLGMLVVLAWRRRRTSLQER